MAGLKLDVGQWKALVLHGMAILGQALQGAQTMDPEGLKWVDERWNILRNQLMVGWENYSRPVIAQAAQAVQQQQAAQQPIPDSIPRATIDGVWTADSLQEGQPVAEPPKKKRADAGKPRGPRKAKDAMPAVSM